MDGDHDIRRSLPTATTTSKSKYHATELFSVSSPDIVWPIIINPVSQTYSAENLQCNDQQSFHHTRNVLQIFLADAVGEKISKIGHNLATLA